MSLYCVLRILLDILIGEICKCIMVEFLGNSTFSFLMQEMSYNNYLDADAAWNCVSEFKNPTCVIVKHTNPCGVASRDDILEAYKLAVKADPVSAFGGIVAFNVEVDEVIVIYSFKL